MPQPDPSAQHWDELGKIDFLLDQLARAVERGDIPYSSYSSLAPRFLSRREYLAELIAQRARTAGGFSPAAGGARTAGVPSVGAPLPEHAGAAQTPTPGAYTQTPAAYAPTPGAHTQTPGAFAQTPAYASTPVTYTPRPERKPVAWTTVLLFLGAFLVVVASAIFAVAVWDWLGAGGKLLFLGTITAGFYAAGWWARTKMDLASGGVVLTAVASALLLFDGWILIDGYGLQGPGAWAGVLLVCSLVYWFTEVRLASGFFGVTGAAAQIGWWWLLGEGIGLPAPVRLAGIALVALLWQVLGRRAKDVPAFASLALVLTWAAPAVAVITVFGLLADLMLVGTADLTVIASAVVVSAACGLALHLTDGIPIEIRRYAAAAAQLPLLAALLVASMPSNPGGTSESVWLAVVFAAVALAYAAVGAMKLGWPFAALGLMTELGLLFCFVRILDASDNVTAVAVAALAATWAAASRVALMISDEAAMAPSVRETGVTAEVGATVVLIAASIAATATASMGPVEQLVPTLAAVLAAWVAAAVARWRLQFVLGAMGWSTYVAVATADQLVLDAAAPLLATVAVCVAGVWMLTSRFTIERPFGPVIGATYKWFTRGLLLVIWVVGSVFAFAEAMWDGASLTGTWPLASLALATSVIFLIDALLAEDPPSSAGSRLELPEAPFAIGVSAVTGAFAAHMAAGAALSAGAGVSYPALIPTAAGTLAGVVFTMVALAIGRDRLPLSRGLAVGGCLGALLSILISGGPAPVWATGLALLAVALFVATPTISQLLVGLAGVVVTLSVWQFCAWLEPSPWGTFAALSLTGFALAAPTFARRLAPGAPWADAGTALALSGLFAHGSLVLAALFSSAGSPAWLNLGPHVLAAAFLSAGALVLLESVFRRIEAGLYVGWALMLLAMLVQLSAMDVTQGEIYTSAGAIYLLAMGYLYVHMGPDRDFPLVLDAAAVLIGLGLPLQWSLGAVGVGALVHVLWVVALSLGAMAFGFFARSRWLFFGGAAALAAVAFYRSFTALAEFWWVWLGLLGVAMLVIALTWERQRLLVTDAKERLRLRFEGWR